MAVFRKRTFPGVGAFFQDIGYLWSQRRLFARPMGVKGIDGALFERLFLAETEVNGCRFCAYAHSRAALKQGVPAEEIRELLSREWGHVPERERPAVAYAQHWTDTYGRPDPEAAATLERTYGAETAERINVALRLMRFCNYVGNLVDLCLFRLSFGRLGGSPCTPAPSR